MIVHYLFGKIFFFFYIKLISFFFFSTNKYKRDLNTKNNAIRLHGPHKDAVLDFAWNNSLVVSGDKSGTIAFWDINTGTPIKSSKIHKGAVS
jgi:WD40 repeat protein